MSDFEPFSSSIPSSPAPMPPPPPLGPPGPMSSAMPSGYVSYGHAGDLPEPSSLRKAVLILFAVVTGLCLVLGVVAYRRGNVADEFYNGSRSIADVNSSDTQVTSVVLLVIIAQVAAAVSRLHTQGVVFVLVAAVLAVTTIRAAKAMPLIDAADASGHRR